MSWKDQCKHSQPLVEQRCLYCDTVLDEERVDFLRQTGRPCVCVRCTEESPKLTLMEYGHKTAGYLVVVHKGDEHKALRAYRRAR